MTPFRLEAAAIMKPLFRAIPAFARCYRTPRQRWHDNLSPDERAEWEALGLEAAQKRLERRGGETSERIYMAIAKWATEERQRASRVPRRSFWVACAALAVSITVGAFTLWHWRESERPKLVTTDARLYINHAGNPPPELIQLFWRNGERAAFRGAATVFTVSEDGNQHEKFGLSEITVDWQSTSTTLVPFGSGYAQIPVDMNKFLGMLLVCVKYYDEENHSYRQTFLFRRGAPFNDHILTRLDELPSKADACKYVR